MADEKKLKDLSQAEAAPLADDELGSVTGGIKSLTSGKWVVTEHYTCDYFMGKQGVDSRYTGTRQCRFCEHMGRENIVVMVCNNPNNT